MAHKEDAYIATPSTDDLWLEEDKGLLSQRLSTSRLSFYRESLHVFGLVAIASILIGTLAGIKLSPFLSDEVCADPSLGIWSPANDLIKYKTVTFESYFLGHEDSPWTRAPKESKDALWDSIYEFGISGISENEASNLLNETLTSPNDPDTYMIQLEVFHLIHCLNMLRKVVYPDQYPELWSYHDNGTINHDTRQAVHIDHCVDALRQSIVCNADVTPISFIENRLGRGIFPDVTATHVCRNFDEIVGWAKAHEVRDYQGKHLH
ncbi:hypothetical protein BDV25DRAFT_143528 [Aspergillus avenaceus]|uniref:Tat pathway signal sequence n=1 Tax=Aspergillus avenaceus TaxID=36643 RepID=A0A5N6TKH7_ASPAV|nr:hypothetical protein BDV25DRAFT_143528 [Aspergillus avenaceus]